MQGKQNLSKDAGKGRDGEEEGDSDAHLNFLWKVGGKVTCQE